MTVSLTSIGEAWQYNSRGGIKVIDRETSALYQIYVTQEPVIDEDYDAFALLDLIVRVSIEDIFSVIRLYKESLLPIVSNNIPQFSKADDIFTVLRVVIDSGIEDLSYEKIGYYLCPRGSKPGAQTKYGENHYKLAVQLGLVTVEKPLTATDLGMAFYLTNNFTKRNEIKKKLALRVPIIQQAILLAEKGTVDMAAFMCQHLSQSTMLRRRPNIRELLQYIMDNAEVPMQHRLNNIVWR